MAFIIRAAKGVRNHWKKSAFAAAALTYGGSYANDQFLINRLMREYCKESAQYGETSQHIYEPNKKVIVLLNPAANKRGAKKTFEKYCEPILHLAGMYLEVITTDSEGHARRYVEELKQLPAAIIVAGGDGTLSEAVTGLLRRSETEICPIGLLPIGRTNLVAQKLYFKNLGQSADVEEIRGIANAAISVVRGRVEQKDVMKIEIIPQPVEENSEEGEAHVTVPTKPIYAMGSIEWGAFRDTLLMRDRYWYWGPMREYMAFLFNCFSSKVTWNCDAAITYTPPCEGCQNCYVVRRGDFKQGSGRWWSRFVPRFRMGASPAHMQAGPDYSKIVNVNCSSVATESIHPSEMLITTSNVDEDADGEGNVGQINIKLGSDELSAFGFVSDSWGRLWNKNFEYSNSLTARTIEIIPQKISTEDAEVYYSIDNETYEVKPIKISLLRRQVPLFTL